MLGAAIHFKDANQAIELRDFLELKQIYNSSTLYVHRTITGADVC